MGRRDRPRQQARRQPFKEVKPTILAVTEGEVTEPEYLRGFATFHKNPRLTLEIVGGVGAPRTIVEKAKALKLAADDRARKEADENLQYDQVWCIFDLDDHANVANSIQMARDNGLEVAFSNPCIELWLWLHFAEQPGPQHRHKLQGMLKQEHLPGYDKHVNFSQLAHGYEEACKRAERLEQTAIEAGEEGRNPSTGVWRLTESIRTHA